MIPFGRRDGFDNSRENQMNRLKTIGMLCVLLLAVASHPALSQTSKGTLAGTVRDKTGAGWWAPRLR